MKISRLGFTLLGLQLIWLQFGCEKDAPAPLRTPFWEFLVGNWRIDSTYTANGQTFTFDEYDFKGTNVKFNLPTNVIGQPTNSFINTEDISTRISGSNPDCILRIINKNGLQLKDSYLSEFYRMMQLGNSSTACELYETIFIGNSQSSRLLTLEMGYYTFYVIPKAGLCKGQFFDQECRDKLESLIESEIDYFEFIAATGTKRFFKIRSKSSTEIEMTLFVPYYGRIINGELQLDEIKITLFRSNISDILSIPPFHPDNYSYSWWHSLGWAQNGLSVFGGASFDDEGVDGKCLHINGAGQYAKFDHKPYAPMTMSFWVKPKTVSRPKQVIFSKYKNQYGPFIFSLEQDKFVMEINDGFGNLQKVSSALSIANNEWTHICLTVGSDNKATLYINGEPDSQGPINSLNYDAEADILFGTAEEALNQGLDVNFRGYLDEIIFFNKVFGKGEVKQLFLWHLTN